MSKRITKLLCCGALLTQLLPLANTTLTASASHYKYRYHTTRNIHQLPKYMQTTLHDYYGATIPRMSYIQAKNRALKLENMWHKLNNVKSIKEKYGSFSQKGYFTRLHNERVISKSTTVGKDINQSIRFYGYLDSSLTAKQKKAIRQGYQARNLTKTQKALLIKYGINNQFIASENRNYVAAGRFNKVRIPTIAHLSKTQVHELHNNMKMSDLTKHQIHVMSTYGMPVENGQTVEATSIYANMKYYYKQPKSNISPTGLKTISDYIKAAQQGIQLPHYIYTVIVSPNGSVKLQTFDTTDPEGMAELAKQYKASGQQIKTDNQNLDKNYSGTNLPTEQSKENQMAQNYLQNSYVSKDDNGDPVFYDIIDNTPVKFIKTNGSWHVYHVSDNEIQDPDIEQLEHNAGFINDGENGTVSMPSDEAALDPNTNLPSDIPSDDTPSNVDSTQDAVPSDEPGNGGLPTTFSDDSENGSGVPNIAKANKMAKEEAKAAKKAEAAKLKARRNALNLAQHYQNQAQNADKSKQAVLNKKRDAAIQLANQDKNLAEANGHNSTAITKENHAQDVNLQKIRSMAASLKPLRKENAKISERDQEAVRHDTRTLAYNMPGLSSREAKAATQYFHTHPDTLIEPSRITNKSAKKMFHIMTEAPQAVKATTDPKRAGKQAANQNKQHKHAKRQEYTNNGLSAYDIQKISQLSQQIQQIERHAQKAKHQSAYLKSVESIPHDGYTTIYQGYGNHPITSRPDDLPGARTVVSTDTIKHINAAKIDTGKFWIVNLIARTSDGQKYAHVMSTNGMVSGWINERGLLANKTIKSKTKLIHTGNYPVSYALRHNKDGLNPDFVDAYEGVLQEYMNGNKDLQKLVHHKFNKHQIPLAHMYSPTDLKSKDKALDNIATRFQELIRFKMNIPQFSNQAKYLANRSLK